MTSSSLNRIILSLSLLLVAKIVAAQGGATIKASVDKNKILLGEPLVLTIEANLSPEAVISFVNIDSISHFEFLNKPRIDTINSNGGTTIRGTYQITSFDSGHWVIPLFLLSPAVKTDTIGVDVVFSEFDSNQDYHDIKDIIEVKPEEKKNWWWYAAGGALLLTLLIIYLLKRKKPQPALVLKRVIDPYEEAMKNLQELEKSNAATKEYHSRLTDIFRLYIFRKKGILSLQKTTDDLVLQMKDLNLGKEQFDKLSRSLRLSDFVKFAKYIPSMEDDKAAFDIIKNSIEEIEKID